MPNRIFPLWPIMVLGLLTSACVPPELDFTPDIYLPLTNLQEVLSIGTTATPTPAYTFRADQVGDIIYGGSCSSATVKTVIGFNTITLNPLGEGTYSNCTITVRNSDGAYSNPLTITSFTISNGNFDARETTPLIGLTNNNTPSAKFIITEIGAAGAYTLSYSGSCASVTTAAATGTNTIVLNALADGTYKDCRIVINDSVSSTKEAVVLTSFTIDKTAPTLAQVTAVTTPSIITTPSYTFSSSEAGTIIYAGDCSSATTAAVKGNNTVTFNALSATTHSNCTISVKDAANNTSTALAVSSFVISPIAVISSMVPQALLPGFETRMSGYNFSTPTTVLINGSAVTPTSQNDHEIRFIAPSLPSGSYTLNLQTGSNGSTSTTVSVKSEFLPGAEIATGGAFVCARKTDKTVWCWGNNSSGELGNNSTLPSVTPVQVSGITTAEALVVGANHACVRLTDNTVNCWGSNAFGQLGNNTVVNSSIPVVVKNIATTGTLSNVTGLSAGLRHTCAMISGGTLNCWGSNANGQLGDNSTTQRNTPVAVKNVANTASLASVAGVSTGTAHSCALITGGSLNCWGLNTNGQLGDNTTTQRLIPVVVKDIAGTGTLASVAAVTAGGAHTCVMLSAGGANCWGLNTSGQLGDNTVTQRNIPVAVKNIGNTGNLASVASIAAGTNHSCVRLTDSSANCWGSNILGQLGDNSNTQRTLPVVVKGVGGTGSLATVATMVSGGSSSCAKLSTNAVKCWGEFLDFSTAPYNVTPISNAISVSIGVTHGCAVISGGTVKCWGQNESGQLGNATTVAAIAPVTVTGIANASQVAVGASHSCARLTDNTVKCWGLNANGQLGNNTTTTSSSPVVVKDIAGTGTLGSVAAISAGSSHTCVRLSGNTVNCWGLNTNGQLGDNTTVQKLLPVVVKDTAGTGTLSSISGITSGSSHNCAVASTGALYCWGLNGNGQLGDNSTTQRNIPVAVSGITTTASQASAGLAHSCVRLTDSTVRCWGLNSSGQLGNNSTTQSLIPVVASGISTASQAVADVNQSCARLSDATVKCWGANNYGQLGDASMTNRLTPVTVTTLKNVADIDLGSSKSCALLTDAYLMCWGQLLDQFRLVPQQSQFAP